MQQYITEHASFSIHNQFVLTNQTLVHTSQKQLYNSRMTCNNSSVIYLHMKFITY